MTDTQEDIDEKFFRTVGYAITEWAVVEGALFDVFYLAISSKERALALTAYHAILSFQTKLTVTTDTLSVRLRYSVGPGTQHNFSSKPQLILKNGRSCTHALTGFQRKEIGSLIYQPQSFGTMEITQLHSDQISKIQRT